MSQPLEGQTALVTGASRGIGRAVAQALVDAGCWVGIVARGEAELRAAATEIGGHAIPADVSEPAAVHALMGYVSELLDDAPDLVINAAGSFALAPFTATDPDLFDAQLSANLRAPFLVSRAFLPDMLERGSGQLVHIGSVAGRAPLPGNAAYAAAKFGLRGMHEVMVQELRGTGVRATLIEPSATDTSLWDRLDPDARDDLPSRAEMLRPEAVAEAVLWTATRPPDVSVSSLALQSSS
ncbi:3-ketoacyl-ACP reductase [soil metagenome]